MNTIKLLVLISSVGIFLSACSGKSGSQNQTDQQNPDMSAGEHAAHANMKMESGEPSDQSIYNVSSRWENRYGYEVQLDSLRGEIQVVAMLYTHCEFACPRILADLKRIRDLLPENVSNATNFTIVSIDPERDTPERLTEFAKENDLSSSQWTFLHGDSGDILELAALLGFKYKRISETDFTHSNLITLLNKEGEIIYQRKKLTDQPSEVVKKIEELARAS